MTALAARGRAALGALLPWIGLAAAAGTVGTGLALDASGTVLGVPHPPFLSRWAPRADPLVLAAVAGFAAAIALAPRLAAPRRGPVAFAAALLVLTLILRLALAAARSGTGAWDRVFAVGRSFEAPNEYLPALPALRYGAHVFLDRFAEVVPALPVHSAGHPPGLLLTMHALGIHGAAGLTALCIGAGALSAPLTYAAARQVLDERGARVAGLLMALAPGALLFGATSADALYATLGVLAAWPLTARSWRLRALGALLLAAGALYAWSLLAVGAWAVLLALLREGPRSALALAALTGAVVAAVLGALAAFTGYDPIGAVRATEQVYRLGIASRRPYAYWLFGSPVAFLVVLGLPIAWLFLRRAAAAAPEAVAIGVVLLIAAVLGFTKAETERIWLFFAPFVCLAAAPAVRRPAVLAAALAAQALAFELLFDTVW